MLRFAFESKILLPLQQKKNRNDVLESLRSIEFTGQNTRIADAVQLGTIQLEQFKRADAIQV